MSGIVKRRKTTRYAQIHNTPLQTLEDIRSIGLLAHLMSLPEDWEIRKMQLYSKFGRAAVTHAIKELESKKYWIEIKYRAGKLNEHIYHISDVPFTDEEVKELIEEIESEFKVMAISEPFRHLLSIDENQQLNKTDSSIVDSQQLMDNNSCSKIENKQLLNKYKQKKDIQINNNKENNNIGNYYQEESITNPLEPIQFKKLMTNAANEFYGEFAPGRWTKQQWFTLIEKFVDETIESGRYINIPEDKIKGYVYKALRRMIGHADYKRSDEFKEYQEVMMELHSNNDIDSDREPLGIVLFDWIEGKEVRK
jgi:hypothetical protein